MKNILIINGHSNKTSLNCGLAEAYYNGAKESGANVKLISIRDLNFDPNLAYG